MRQYGKTCLLSYKLSCIKVKSDTFARYPARSNRNDKTNVYVLINRRIESFPKPKYIILHVKTISIFSNSRHSRQSRTTYVSIEEIYAEKNRISLLASYISRVFSHTRSKRVYIHLFLLHTLYSHHCIVTTIIRIRVKTEEMIYRCAELLRG